MFFAFSNVTPGMLRVNLSNSSVVNVRMGVSTLNFYPWYNFFSSPSFTQ